MKPTKGTSRSRTGTRRSHHGLKPLTIHKDEEGNAHLPHHATPLTGKYRGKQAKDVAKRTVRRVKKLKAIS
ncbi:MAG: 50S ribosomal protein L32 [Candidatus Magasanikbacteria bacterium]|jgi:ribosomal protein L32|nr:50S ribosomal protein L32 [Candidatus Magasanikbacteria bacterium]MBT4220739.1 50S ribosomal protein L32 [Candidatus Magasanikbacteria bacterium]MBT4350084.1 50S ribosomal protein L32 [Candidatus Magasanikbacteria bacterium]MBT4541473.1 50S ribosomal protein L32 [Candidatus Magasanikbacteria bacterium]MBT6253001.1 50S ribosomal protein L32 [Candidatus Magasanikbacteria bacterium]